MKTSVLQVIMTDGASPSDTPFVSNGDAAAAAAEATAREIPQGGGTAARAASSAASAARGLRPTTGPMVFREVPNPSLRSPAPIFIRPQTAVTSDAEAGKAGSRGRGRGISNGEAGPTGLSHAKPGGKGGVAQGKKVEQKKSQLRVDRPLRVQHDDTFDALDAELMAEA